MTTHSNDISLIIKTFERQPALERLLASIRDQGYADYPVLVADDSKTPYKDAILRKYGDVVDEYIVLPFDAGLSRGRNELLERVKTPYFMLNDDDFVFIEETDIEWAIDKLNQANLDILSGTLIEKERVNTFPMIPNRLSTLLGLYRERWTRKGWIAEICINDDGGVEISPVRRENSEIQRCDLVPQFFVGRTCKVWDSLGGWNSNMKSFGEHWEFFYRAKLHNLKVATSDKWLVKHEPRTNNVYSKFRYDREREGLLRSVQQAGIPYLKKGSDTIYNPAD